MATRTHAKLAHSNALICGAELTAETVIMSHAMDASCAECRTAGEQAKAFAASRKATMQAFDAAFLS